MEQIKIIFFLLGSFFGMDNGQIASDYTTVTVNPQSKEITIIQEKLFTVIPSEKNIPMVLQQWDGISNYKSKNTPWAKELSPFTVKNLDITTEGNLTNAKLTLSYTNEEALRAMGFWFDKDKNKFAINNIPESNIKSEDGTLMDNYLVFDGAQSFSFTLEPFLKLPEQYLKFKKPIQVFLKEQSKK